MPPAPHDPATPANILLITARRHGRRHPRRLRRPGRRHPATRRPGRRGHGLPARARRRRGLPAQPVGDHDRPVAAPQRRRGFEPVDDDVPVLTDLLAAAGLPLRHPRQGRTPRSRSRGSAGTPSAGMRELGMGRDPERYGGQAPPVLRPGRATQDRPWFLMANAHDPHRPFHGSLDEREQWSEEERASYPGPSARPATSEREPPPGFLPDLPARAAGVPRVPRLVPPGRRRRRRRPGRRWTRSGQADDTLVLFLSDNGMAFPFAKANCYLRSTLTPFIVRWPGRGRTGLGRCRTRSCPCSTSSRPSATLLGIDPGDVDGRSLLPLLTGADRPPARRDRVFTVFHETSVKRRFEMRCVQDAALGIHLERLVGRRPPTYRAENMMGLTWRGDGGGGPRPTPRSRPASPSTRTGCRRSSTTCAATRTRW